MKKFGAPGKHPDNGTPICLFWVNGAQSTFSKVFQRASLIYFPSVELPVKEAPRRIFRFVFRVAKKSSAVSIRSEFGGKTKSESGLGNATSRI
jgi:hypothetical protein